jgi:hypothetical protein
MLESDNGLSNTGLSLIRHAGRGTSLFGSQPRGSPNNMRYLKLRPDDMEGGVPAAGLCSYPVALRYETGGFG